ncbi:MAG: BatA and WFA domain-containing protein [Planctomycetota bacterium]
MTFASPWMLWSLLALVPLAAAYFLKVRPRRRPTTALFLWERILEDRKANRLWQRLRSIWSLLLMAAAVGAVGLALGEPRWPGQSPSDLLIVIDNSASMRASGEGGVRIELAKREARNLARALGSVQRAAVATAAGRVRYASHLTENPRELIAAIDAIEPTYEAFNAEVLAGLTNSPEEENAEGEANNAPSLDDALPRRIVLITDGVLGGQPAPEGVELIAVGGKRENAGIVGADAEFSPIDRGELTVYYQTASTAPEAIDVDLLVWSVDGEGERRLARVVPLVIEPGLNVAKTLSVSDAEPGSWQLELDADQLADRLDGGDALPDDNTAWLVARRPPPVSVAVSSADPYFFEQSVRAFTGSGGLLQLVTGDGEVTLGSGAVPADRAVVFHPGGASPWWEGEPGGDVDFEVGAPRVLDAQHPVIRRIDPLLINYVGARRLKAPPGARVLVEADDGTPLIYTASRAGGGAVVVNLDPVASEFYFSAWFPVLVHAAAEHLAGREEPLRSVYRPGQSPRLPGAAEAFTGQVTGPTGEPASIETPRLADLAELGDYQVTGTARGGGERNWRLACSLLAENETLLSPPKKPPRPADLASGSPPAGWLVALAIAAATAESILYHRRKVG